MQRFLLALLCAAMALPCGAQSAGSELAAILNFEGQRNGGNPAGWGGGPAGSLGVDDKIVHGGKWAARIENKTAGGFATLTKAIPMDFSGTRIQFRGFLRTEDVTNFVGLWMREDGETPNLAFDNMEKRQLKGTTDWAEYSISLRSQESGVRSRNPKTISDPGWCSLT